MVTLQLIHPIHGVVNSRTFILQATKYHSVPVKKAIRMWEQTYGKKYFECTLKWED